MQIGERIPTESPKSAAVHYGQLILPSHRGLVRLQQACWQSEACGVVPKALRFGAEPVLGVHGGGDRGGRRGFAQFVLRLPVHF